MSYAPHINRDVQYNPSLPLILGRFKEVTHNQVFEYGLRTPEDQTFVPEYPHLVYVSSKSEAGLWLSRYAKVLKTVAYVVTDEDENGPIVEKWFIKGHRLYPSV
jgi:hypothetical protein